MRGEQQLTLTKRYTENNQAYEAYLKGRYMWNKRTVDSLQKALGYFQQAVRLDPNYALAYVGLADTYTLLSFFTLAAPSDAFPKAKAAAANIAASLKASVVIVHSVANILPKSVMTQPPGVMRPLVKTRQVNASPLRNLARIVRVPNVLKVLNASRLTSLRANVVIVPVGFSRGLHSSCGGTCCPFAIVFTFETGLPRA